MFETSIYCKPLSLPDWHFVFGLPTNRRGFEKAAWAGEFVSHPAICEFPRYREMVLDPFERMIGAMAGRGGIRLTRHASSRQFAAALQGQTAVMLFTHSSGTHFEFSDGMVPYGDILRKVPENFGGIVDLVACEPRPFLAALKRRAPAAAGRCVQRRLGVSSWLGYAAAFLMQFSREPTSYMVAALQVAQEFRDPEVAFVDGVATTETRRWREERWIGQPVPMTSGAA